ncbi:hypothetical protein J2X76_004769 [Neorhizobium sp. 2083]|uniref:hypothetical protein n=1 Tax=Neorhizobium sp. 2083 TaxID=2817762 RepID=UPI002861BD52|nr:hypothetical protein [Neorhizobium sp. 2083]MDR6819577.1 hypothetical protein [Neorhizobium sp. 2083]
MKIIKLQNSNVELLFNYTYEYVSERNAFLQTICTAHEKYEWRKLRISTGSYQVRRQCLCCGHVFGDARSHSDDDIFLRWTDPDLKSRYLAKRKKEEDALIQKHALKQAKAGVFVRYDRNKRLRDRLFIFDGTEQGKKRLDAELGVGSR